MNASTTLQTIWNSGASDYVIGFCGIFIVTVIIHLIIEQFNP